jgi:hypothetical protein
MPFGGPANEWRMQKHASRLGWRFAGAATAALALIQLISVAGLPLSAGMMGAAGRQSVTNRRPVYGVLTKALN